MQRKSTSGTMAHAAVLSGALTLMILPHLAHGQELQGAIVVSRDVPERYAFLPGAGEALTVKTAPFGDVWSGTNPAKVLSDVEAENVVGQQTPGPGLLPHGFGHPDNLGAAHSGVAAGGTDRSGSFASSVGGVVGQSLETGLGALKTGLGQMQSALGPR